MIAANPDPECKVCGHTFRRASTLQTVCGTRCAIKLPAATRRAERRQDAAKREALKTRKQLEREAQIAFNAFVRARDRGRPCICCGAQFEPQKPGGSADAGHYLSIGSAPNLRFDEANVHAQRKNCNRPGGTTRAQFRAGMVERIGLAEVERLEADQAPRKYTADELRALRATYLAKARAV